MKEITGFWSKCDSSGDVIKVTIKDGDAIKACGRDTQIDWTVPQAAREFNAHLKKYGFEITRIEYDHGNA